MPSISRVRIVNFRYNDGGRLIPDILLNFEDSDRQTVNTLLDLENGGGKSVLVQLLLQPVIPNASVQKRKLGEYFRKTSDHAYILVEWKLDRSIDHLLTGIAIASAQNSEENDESKSVKYFTFINHYDNMGDKYDIINFPLSQKQDGKMTIANFEDVRKAVRNSQKTEYFHSDNLKNYQTRIEEYGIIHSEWENILVKINENEGGIEKFFDMYNANDKLLDGFIIPGIIGVNKKNRNTEDETLVENMFLNYAKSCSDKDEKLRLRDDIIAFVSKLEEFRPEVQELWNLSDKKDHDVHRLFDYVFSLEEYLKKLEIDLADIESEIKKAEEQKKHIQIEELSWQYYDVSSDYDDLKLQCDQAQKSMNDADEKRKYYEHQRDVFSAAEKYQELTKNRKTEAALSEQIKQLDGGNMSGYTASLKYSLLLSAEKELKKVQNFLSDLNDEISANEKTSEEYSSKIKELGDSFSKLKSEHDRLCGENTFVTKSIEEGLNNINISVDCMLDGTYNSEQLIQAESDIHNQKTKYNTLLCSLNDEKSSLSSQKTEKSIEKNNFKSDIDKCNDDISKIESLLEEYHEKYNQIYSIIRELSMDEKLIFTEEPVKYITEAIAQTNDEIVNVTKTIDVLQEQYENARKGTLHLPKSAVDFFDKTGIDYQTGSSYLVEHETIREKLLENEPLLAFSIIVENNKSRNCIFDSADNEWVSSIVPVFTRQDIADVSDGPKTGTDNLLAAYCNDYFRDPDTYAENLHIELENKKEYKNKLEQKCTAQQDKLTLLNCFTYTSDFEKSCIADQIKINEEKQNIQEKLKQIDDDVNKINNRQKEIKTEITQATESLLKASHNESEFMRIKEYINKLYETCEKISELECQLNSLENNKKDLCVKLEDIQKKHSELYDSVRSKQNDVNEYKSVISETNDSEPADIIDKTYLELKAEYDLKKELYSSDRKRLEEQLSGCREEIKRLADDIISFDVSESEYSSVEFSQEAFRNSRENQRRYQRIWEEQLNDFKSLNADCKIEKTKLDDIESKLNHIGGTLLPKSEVGDITSFQPRLDECSKLIKKLYGQKNEIEGKQKDLSSDSRRIQNDISNYSDPYPDRANTLLEFSAPIYDKLSQAIRESRNDLEKKEKSSVNKINDIFGEFTSMNSAFANVVFHIREVIENESTSGDRYYTLCEKLQLDIQNFNKRKEQLDIDLKDVEESRSQLVDNCLHRSKRLYDDLKVLAKKSRVNVFDKSKQMIQITLPEISEDDKAPFVSMEQYIDEKVNEFLSSPDHSDFKKREQMAAKYMNMRRLLNCYIGRENIPVSVFKIDRTLQNSKYRSWDNSLKANSGGEKFVVLFSLIISMMNFSRGVATSLKDTSGVLVLDNPFGPISSPHLLIPMFDIAERFHIQLICLTHLRNADIRKSFSNVYQLKLKSSPLSSVEQLEAEPQEHMEQAYYRSEQLSF